MRPVSQIVDLFDSEIGSFAYLNAIDYDAAGFEVYPTTMLQRLLGR